MKKLAFLPIFVLIFALAVPTLLPATASAAYTGDLPGLKAAAATGGIYQLVADIATNETYTATRGGITYRAGLIVERDLAIDLNGHSLTITLGPDVGAEANGIKIAHDAILLLMDSSESETGALTIVNEAMGSAEIGCGAGINTADGALVIDGGTIHAVGGPADDASSDTVLLGGAGIGGGCNEDGGFIAIYGGTVTAIGGGRRFGGAGIGGGSGSSKWDGGGNYDIIDISGGTVTATGSGRASGVGCGSRAYPYPNKQCKIMITGGTVTATGGKSGAGIRGIGRYGNDAVAIGGDAIVTAIGGDYGAGIGGGYYSGGCSVSVSDNAHVTAQGTRGGSGIGGGGGGTDGYGVLTVNGGTVTAIGGDGDSTTRSGAGIHCGTDADHGFTMRGGTVTAIGRRQALEGRVVALPGRYVYWTNTSADPDGAAQGSYPRKAFPKSKDAFKYVKIQSGDNVPPDHPDSATAVAREEVYPGMFTDGWEPIEAKLNQRMATRTGPGTKFTEDHGTLPKDTKIVVYAQEVGGSTVWALVEFEIKGKLVRAYTGVKRIDMDTDAVPSTAKEPLSAMLITDTAAYYGPGEAYLKLANQVESGAEVLVYGIDRGYALIEYPVGDAWMRSWVPEDYLAFQ